MRPVDCQQASLLAFFGQPCLDLAQTAAALAVAHQRQPVLQAVAFDEPLLSLEAFALVDLAGGGNADAFVATAAFHASAAQLGERCYQRCWRPSPVHA
jgi:hypothetical protein